MDPCSYSSTDLQRFQYVLARSNVAAPKRDKHVRCVLSYEKKSKEEEEVKEYELETLGDHTTWAKLVERCVHALWPNSPPRPMASLTCHLGPLS